MNKKFLSAILFGALMVTSTGTFVSCKDYDDDIDNLQTQIDANAAAITELKTLVQSGDYVTGVSVSGNNLVVTFKNAGSQTIALPEQKDEVGSYVKVEGGVLYIDGVATDIKVCETPVVEENEFLPAVKIDENGEWAVLQEDRSYLSTGVLASSVAVAENTKGGYTLTIKDAAGEETEVELPATKVITDLQAVTVTETTTGATLSDAVITVYYGTKVTATNGLTFNGTTYAAGTYLLSQDAKLSAIVNPQDADATKYEFKLVDSKNNAPFVVSEAKQNMTEKAINADTRAASANTGVWDLTLAIADATDVAVGGIYSLTTETVNGTVASPYDVKITASQAAVSGVATSLSKDVNYNTEFDLSELIAGDWVKYVVDYYFEITDQTAAANNNVTLTNGVIKTTKNATFAFSNLQAKVLLVNGTVKTIPVTINFKQVAPSADALSIAWTINDTNVTEYLSLSAIQAQLAGSSDTSLPAFEVVSCTWADGTALNDKSVLVNGVNYGKAVTTAGVTNVAFNSAWITSLDATQLYSLNTAGTAYIAATSIQNAMYAKFTFDATTAFPGEYIVNVGFRKNGATSGDYALVVPVKVTITAPTQTIVKHDNYFSGINAVAYGEANGTVAKYNLNDLFKTTGLTFTETVVKNANGVAYAAWLGTDGHTISVPVYNNATNADNTVTVGSSHEFTASILPFSNPHIAKTTYTFNLTVKSAINEGTFTSSASKTIATSQPVTFNVSDFTATDVFGDKFYIANTYVYNATTKTYTETVDEATDSRIASVTITAADDNATNYLDFDSAFKAVAGEATDVFEVSRKSGLTQLVADTECKLNVTILDKWGVMTTTTVTVVLQKFGN